MSTELTQLGAALRQDRAVILAGVTMAALAAWAYLVHLVWELGTMDDMVAIGMTHDMVMPQMQSWGAIELLLLFVMWAVMMVAMMVPSVAPLILMFARANRQKARVESWALLGFSSLGTCSSGWASASWQRWCSGGFTLPPSYPP
ncbi:MAG: DUF2182 domain-containing protein [Candidatus Binatia bacterium]